MSKASKPPQSSDRVPISETLSAGLLYDLRRSWESAGTLLTRSVALWSAALVPVAEAASMEERPASRLLGHFQDDLH